ncbi:META domain-containing protein [uncultured Oxalicibacterium sp.]|uniref:META domain-containing protein n=1 Tax=uncultured Oxalicibacterium sp. TaxID=1168540 RepID=UPI0025D1FDFB|nr:META domain-containing protein [uncultured Oxalicibacterium sp.]
MSAKWFIAPVVLMLASCAAPTAKVTEHFPATYRAAGNEPFWHLRMQDQTITVERPDSPPFLTSVTGIAETDEAPHGGWYAEGKDIRMQIWRERCEDDMSGQPFEHRVFMQLQGREYRGCGGSGLPPARLEETQWLVSEIRGQAVRLDAPPSLMIDPNGQVAGSDGCNRIAGGFHLESDGTVRHPASGWMATRMACAAPRMQVAQQYGDALRAAQTWRFDGAALIMQDKNGATVLRYRQTY